MRNRAKKNAWRIWRPVYKFTWAVWQRRSYKHYAKLVNSLENACILDIGTGTGEYIKYINPSSNCRFIFTDPDETSLKIAKKRAIHKGLNCEFIVGYADEVVEQIEHCTHLSLIHVLSVINDPFEFIDSVKLKYGNSVNIFAYLSRFNATKGSGGKSNGVGFSRLDKESLDRRFKVKKISPLNNFYKA